MYIFLDIDGVLNSHMHFPNGYCGINPECVKLFNQLQYKYLVISSAWRYLVHNRFMTVKGFENLLLTHGLNCSGRVHGVTRPDMWINEPRENQINDYIRDHKIDKHIILDDLDLKISNFYKVKNGLVADDIRKIYELYKTIN